MERPFCHHHRVSYADCTVGNHVYHARYLDFLEAARGEFLRVLDATVEYWQAQDTIFPVIEARLRYRFPARYDDLLSIAVWPSLAEGVRVNFGHRITNQDNKLILEAETFHACTSTGDRPKRIPQDLVEKLTLHLP